MQTFDYHLQLFLIYNKRRVNREWKDDKGAEILKAQEERHAFLVAEKLPHCFFIEVVDTGIHKVKIEPSLLSSFLNRTIILQ